MLQSLEVDLDLIDLFLEVVVTFIEADLFLLHDHLLVLEVDHSLVDLLKLVVFMHENGLFFDPFSV